MRNSYFALLALLAAAVTSCGPKNAYTIDGTTPDSTFNGKTVYLVDLASHDAIDSAVVADGKFSFAGSVEEPRICRLQLSPYRRTFVLEGGNIKVDFREDPAITGTPLNQELNDFNTAIEELEKSLFEKQQELLDQGTSEEEIHATLIDFQENVLIPEYNKAMTAYFEKNSNNAVGAWVVFQMSPDPAQFDSLMNIAGDDLKTNPLIVAMAERQELLKKTGEGTMFVDFTIEQPDGTQASLSDYVGKGHYVLVDFWASWCGPCRGEIPNIKELYEKYHNDGLDVLGVAVWDKPEDTLKAIENLGIVWPQIINAQSVPTDLYAISGIPHIILFAPDGTVVARDLRDKKMKEKVAEVMEALQKP